VLSRGGGSNAILILSNQSGGTIDADISGGALLLNAGPITNAGLLVANRTGILQIEGPTVSPMRIRRFDEVRCCGWATNELG
jgi:hypothetical protein